MGGQKWPYTFLKDSNKTSENSKLNGHIIMLKKWNFLSQQPRMSFEIFNILKLIDHKVYNVCFYWCFWSFVQKLFFMKNSEFTIFHKNTVLDSFLFLNHHKSMFCILLVKIPCGIVWKCSVHERVERHKHENESLRFWSIFELLWKSCW